MPAFFNRLWFKLTAAFGLIIVVGILVTVYLARQNTATQISHVMVGNQMVDPTQLQQDLAAYYSQHAGWLGLDQTLKQLIGQNPQRRMRGMMGPMMGSALGVMGSQVQVVDRAGVVVADSAGPPGGQVPSSFLSRGWPIQVDGQTVGILFLDGPQITATNQGNVQLLDNVTRSVLVAGLVAGGLALLLAGLFVRQITHPLSQLAQAARQIAQGDLQSRVALSRRDELGDVAHSFNQMAESLQQQESLRRSLMADIAHELRTPLSGIQGTVEALQDGVFSLSIENLAPIHEQVLLLRRLVEDLRTLAHAEAGQLSLTPEVVDVGQLLIQVAAAFTSQAVAGEITLTVDAPDTPFSISADPQRLEQVLANLVSNGLRHTPAGGRLALTLEGSGAGVKIGVVDSGVGIAPADLPHLFDRFYRADLSRSRESGGSGLGLAIARQLVEAHGGRIWAESPPPGQAAGSGFYVALPAEPPTWPGLQPGSEKLNRI